MTDFSDDGPKDDFDRMDRKQLKKYIKTQGIDIKVYKGDSDDEIRHKIRDVLVGEVEQEEPIKDIDDDIQGDFVELQHFVYGSYKGYMMKAKTADIDTEGDTEPFMGMLLPVSQADLKTVEDVRFLIPAGWNSIYLSRVFSAGKDDKGRGTISNHTVFIPRTDLEKNLYTYEDVIDRIIKFDEANPDALGEIPPLKVPITNKKPDYKELRNILSKKIVANLINKYTKNKEQKIFLKYEGSSRDQRIKAIFLLSMLLDVKLKVIPLAAFSDTPYTQAKSVFNLIIARQKIGIKPGGDWIMVNVDSKTYDGESRKEDIIEALEEIYG